jgi:hypothetical protein
VPTLKNGRLRRIRRPYRIERMNSQQRAIQALPVRLRDAADAQRSSHRFGETAFACGLACQP